MIICTKDKQVRDAIASREKEIGIKVIDNMSNAFFGFLGAGFLGAAMSQQNNTTQGMQAILQDSGYKYVETKFIWGKGKIMLYKLKSLE